MHAARFLLGAGRLPLDAGIKMLGPRSLGLSEREHVRGDWARGDIFISSISSRPRLPLCLLARTLIGKGTERGEIVCGEVGCGNTTCGETIYGEIMC